MSKEQAREETVNNDVNVNRYPSKLSRLEWTILEALSLSTVGRKELRRYVASEYQSKNPNRLPKTRFGYKNALSPVFRASFSRCLKRLEDRGLISCHAEIMWETGPHRYRVDTIKLTSTGREWWIGMLENRARLKNIKALST